MFPGSKTKYVKLIGGTGEGAGYGHIMTMLADGTDAAAGPRTPSAPYSPGCAGGKATPPRLDRVQAASVFDIYGTSPRKCAAALHLLLGRSFYTNLWREFSQLATVVDAVNVLQRATSRCGTTRRSRSLSSTIG